MNTPESIGREAGKAIADSVMDAVEGIALKLTDAIAQTRAEQAELRDEVHALSNRIESVARAQARYITAFCSNCHTIRHFTEGKCDLCAAPLASE